MTERKIRPVFASAGMKLFSFMRADTTFFQDSLEHLVGRSELYLSSRRSFNDPFDMNPILKCDWTTSGIRQHMKNIAAQPHLSGATLGALAGFLSRRGAIDKRVFGTKNLRTLKDRFPGHMSKMLDEVGIPCL
jgi:hypothetical protein